MRLRRFLPKLAASILVSLAVVGASAAQTPPPVVRGFNANNAPRVVTFVSLLSFDGTTGAFPGLTSLVEGTDGNFYGTAGSGGDANYGTVFSITSAGVLTTLYSFCAQANCVDGSYPEAGLVQATDGNFYGTTFEGGA